MNVYLIVFLCQLAWPPASPVAETRCGSQAAEAWLQSRYPDRPSRAEFERWLQDRMATQPGRSDTLITLPVIVHIVHQGESPGQGDNLSAAQVASQLAVLNEDFRRLAGTPGFNTHPAGADTRIEFCPATEDPDGLLLPEPGIRRISRQDLGLGPPPYARALVQSSVQPATIWDPTQYLNLWTIALAGELLGFAQSPDASTLPDLNPQNGPALTDGVVITSRAFGRGGSAQPPYDQGRTTTHEVGHWLGLWHIWGDGDCSQDDYCPDTPPADAPTYQCPPAGFACGGATMVDNYMDYTDDACMRVFTQCQKGRMRTVLTQATRRASLGQSRRCQGQAPPVAAFTQSQTHLCPGGSVRFQDASLHSPLSREWTFAGGTPATATEAAPRVRYDLPGRYAVTLTVTNASGSSSLVREAYIAVGQPGPQLILAEDFAQGLGPWRVDNPDQAFGWEWTEASGSRAGPGAAYIPLYYYPTLGARDRLISPVLDLQGFASVQLTLDHAYRTYQGAHDSLLIRVSTDSGQHFPDRLYAGVEDGQGSLATGPPLGSVFVPSGAGDWCHGAPAWAACLHLDLPPAHLQPDLAFCFETVNDFGNNVYLDRIRLTGSCAVTADMPLAPAAPLSHFSVGPHPARDYLHLHLHRSRPGPLHVSLLDAQGRLCAHLEAYAHHPEWERRWAIGPQAAGLYLVRIQQGPTVHTARVYLY